MAQEEMGRAALLLHEQDDVAVLRHAVQAGTELVDRSGNLRVVQDVPLGHKIAVRAVRRGEPVRKYGQIIGFACRDIRAGEHVHTHNLEVREFGRDYQFGVDYRPVELYAAERMRYFQGYRRPDGRVGTRNMIAVIATVNCSASVCRYVADRFRDPGLRRDYPNVDGVVALTHKTGCAIPPGEPLQRLQRVVAGYARHPNVFGYVLIGLGCETNEVAAVVRDYRLDARSAGQPEGTFLTIQETGGTSRTVEAACAAVRRLLPQANESCRTRQPVSQLVLGLECGGSDASSGITANPAVGVASDELVRYGGKSVLAETPEIYGAEHLLIRRAASRAVGEKVIELIRWWEHYTGRSGATIDNNPTPGNKAGGLTTIYEKSLGAVAKAGQSPLAAVYPYAEPVTATGLSLMDTPGFDPVSLTGLVAGGCNLAVFTTGRGSVYGGKPTPCLKVATNTALYEQMTDDMDINAGTILDGTETLGQVGMRIFERLLAVASGERTRSEMVGIGEEEFAPWDLGPVL